MPETTATVEKPAGDAASVTPADLVAPLGSRMPGVTESATPETPAPSTTETPSNPFADFRDKSNQRFNPARHQLGGDGKPKIGKTGNFVMRMDYREAHRRAGGQPSTEAPKPPPSFDTGQPRVDPNLPKFDEYDAAAEIYLLSAYGPVIIAFSEHARPDAEEHAALKTAVANYLRVKQIKEPSPGWSLLFVVLAIGVKKSANPIVRERATELAAKLGLVEKKKPVAVETKKE